MLVFWLPAALAGIAVRGVRGTLPGDEAVDEAGDAPLPVFWVRFGEFVVRRAGLISGACLLLMVASIPGVLRLQISMSLLEEFREDAEVLRMGAWIEDRLADLTTCEVALRFPEVSRLSGFERLQLTRRLQSECLTSDSVSGAIHMCNYYPEALRSRGPQEAAVRAVECAWLPLALAAATTSAGLL
ncbi:MAG: hypothetical protein ACKON9_10360, partial [Planctomycetaceae bacterium]